MHFPRSLYLVLVTVSLFAFLAFLHSQGIPNQLKNISGLTASPYTTGNNSQMHSLCPTGTRNFQPGVPKYSEINYSRVVILPCMKEDEIAWIKKELPTVDIAVFVANDSTASLHPPKNKGHEVVIYLSYIIENYASLPDISIFMHSHRWTHHNNDLLDYDAVSMITRLRNSHVIREGYVNMRCDWDPGCPEWLHPTNLQTSLGKQEEAVLSRCWGELFPFEPLPNFLAQACCAQFALSKERILSIPLSRFIFFRNWILMTPLSDYISGRIWEYSWHYIFTGRHVNCPAEHVCYCDSFGVCFGGESQYQDFLELRLEKENLESELEGLKNKEAGWKEKNHPETNGSASVSTAAMSFALQNKIEALKNELQSLRLMALKRGENAENRTGKCAKV